MDEAVKAELARLRDEDNRQNHRIDDLEQSVKAIQDLTISVHALAQDMRQMLSELKDQGTRLERFDGRLEALALAAKPGAAALVNWLRRQEVRVIAVSDMYLGHDHVCALLDTCGLVRSLIRCTSLRSLAWANTQGGCTAMCWPWKDCSPIRWSPQCPDAEPQFHVLS